MSTPLFLEVVPEIDANPSTFYGGGEGRWGQQGPWSLSRHSLPYVINFKVAVIEFAYDVKVAVDSLKKILDA